jgi:uncharacterized membrane protein YtjA (UPF0391 family)
MQPNLLRQDKHKQTNRTYSSFAEHDAPSHSLFTMRGVGSREENSTREITMLNWIITFFLMAVVAAVLGFGGLAGTFAEIAKFLSIIFIVLFIASLIYSMVTGRRPVPPTL